MSPMIKLSIITICYNAERTIRATIDNVLAQKTDNIEYIIVDGGSEDSTLDIIDSYGSAINKVIYDVKGISNSFNSGIAVSQGQWIGTINADDWYEMDCFKRLIELITHQPDAEIVCGKLRYWRNDKLSYIVESRPELLHREMTVNHPSTFIKKEVYGKFGNYSASYEYAMDYELMLRMRQNKVRIIGTEMIFANMRDNGLSDVRWLAAVKETRRAKLTHFNKGQVNIYFVKQLIRVFVSRLLIKLKLYSIINLYRSKFSIVKKTAA